MAKYERDWDSTIFDEDEIEDAIAEEIDDDILEEAMGYFLSSWIFKHLDEEARMMIYDKAREIVLEEYFTEVDDEDE